MRDVRMTDKANTGMHVSVAVLTQKLPVMWRCATERRAPGAGQTERGMTALLVFSRDVGVIEASRLWKLEAGAFMPRVRTLYRRCVLSVWPPPPLGQDPEAGVGWGYGLHHDGETVKE